MAAFTVISLFLLCSSSGFVYARGTLEKIDLSDKTIETYDEDNDDEYENIQREHVCEFQTLHLECGPEQGISILSANYGRLDRNICSDNQWNTDTDSCSLETSLDIMRANCDSFRSCDVAATNLVFGNPCGNIFKYLEVTYVCNDRTDTREYTCEHQSLHLECSLGQVLSIESANYGRLSRDVCSNNEFNKNTDTCRTFNTLYIVQANCDDTRSCDVPATNTMFGNPCGDVFKYLEAAFTCQDSESTRAIACEQETLHLECSEGQYISIQSANYGRLHRNVCANNEFNKNTDSCRSDTSMTVVSEKCDNQRSCDLPASNDDFGNPCDDIYKYLEVFYSCEVDESKPLI